MDAKLKAKAMMDDELNNVAGGTHTEMVQLYSAISEKIGKLGSGSKFGAYIPGLSEIPKSIVIDTLKNKYDIEAHIDIGWLGLGIASEKNTYKDIKTGKSLTHQEVMKRIGQ